MKIDALRVLWLVVVGVLGFGCSKTDSGTIDLSQEQYYPLNVGLERFFQIDSIFFVSKAGGVFRDSASVQVRERVADTLRSLSGELVYRIEHFERQKPSEPWVLRKVVSEYRSQNRLIRTEDNLPLIKMVFPLHLHQKWGSTVFLDPVLRVTVRGQPLELFKGWASELSEWQSTWHMGGKKYEQTLTIQTANFENALELRQGLERYTQGVGLIYRELQILDTQCLNCQGQTWEKKAQRGFILRQCRI